MIEEWENPMLELYRTKLAQGGETVSLNGECYECGRALSVWCRHCNADELTRLTTALSAAEAQCAVMKGALEPFAKLDTETYLDTANCHVVVGVSQCGNGFTVSEIHRARQALSTLSPQAERLLKVVEAAKKMPIGSINEGGVECVDGDAFDTLCNALAALTGASNNG